MKEATARFPYRLAAIDLDDTLLGPDKRISEQNASAVQSLRNLGVMVVLASGRSYENILNFHQQLGLRGLIVSSDGALVKNAETSIVLQQHSVPTDLAAKVMADGLAYGLTLICYYTDGVYVSESNELTTLYQQRSGEQVTVDSQQAQELRSAPLKVIWCGNPQQIAAVHKAAEASYQAVLNITLTDPEYLVFTAFGVDKAVGLAAVANYYNIEPTEVIAFGDGNNDVLMLAWAGLGVAMSNARPSAKRAAKLVASPGNPETSFARAMEMILISKLHPA
ncbi:Cof-type HAD-IIB family hydrolase [Scytonema sp. PCC 10023]|uniref:Cof-type HAD-IIB family hydrolase n=1 Tax=Scytonema sp. PCC 10023 TaxID=1680591 RepID=UPI0039C62F73